jgi:hypothetical protein
MRQAEFDLTPPTERHPWRVVRETSIAQYVEGREWLDARALRTLRAFAAYFNRHQDWPTTAEAYAYEHPEQRPVSADFKLGVLNYRRAVWDLQKRGVMESDGVRLCKVSKKRKIETWRVIPVGR